MKPSSLENHCFSLVKLMISKVWDLQKWLQKRGPKNYYPSQKGSTATTVAAKYKTFKK